MYLISSHTGERNQNYDRKEKCIRELILLRIIVRQTGYLVDNSRDSILGRDITISDGF
jgi:hypothetical protein